MKANKLFWALASVFAVFALSSCDPKEPTGPSDDSEVVVPGDDDDDYADEEEPVVEEKPSVANPDADKTTFLFQVDGAACEDFELYLMGIGGVWEDTPETKFERVEGTTSWFQVTVPAMDESQSNFKIRANGDWTYEPKQGYEFLDNAADFVAGGADGGNSNNLMMLKPAGGQVIALKVIEFVTPCAEAVTYTITLKTNYCGAEGSDVALSGNITGCVWDGEPTPMEKIDDITYTYTIENGMPGMEFKFQSTEGGWVNQPIEWIVDDNNPEGAWNGGLANFKLVEGETEILIDLTDATKYVWGACAQ
jgi:hypothetical protein